MIGGVPKKLRSCLGAWNFVALILFLALLLKIVLTERGFPNSPFLPFFLGRRSALTLRRRFVHIGFTAPPELFTPERVALAWAILRTRHPLLGAKVVAGREGEEGSEYLDVRFE